MRKKYYSLLIVVAAIMWSIDALLRRTLHQIPPATITLLEHSLRLFILLPIVPRFKSQFKKLKGKDWLNVVGLGITAALASIMFTAALGRIQFIKFSVVALLQQAQPIFTVLLAIIILKEKINFRYLSLAALALIAAYFLSFPSFRPTFLYNQGELTAVLLALGAAFAWASGVILGKLILKKISYMAVAFLRFAVVVPIALIVSFTFNQTYPLAAINPTQWFYLLIMALFTGVASFAIYYKGLQYTEAKVATFAGFAYPLSAAVIGFVFLGERLTGIQLLAGGILLADVLVLSLTSPQKISD